MADNDNKKNDNASLGDKIRGLIEPALDDERRPEIQLQKLDQIFNQVAGIIPRALETEFNHFSRAVDNETKNAPENRHPMIIEALTVMGQGGESQYSPIKKYGLPISTAFTDFAAADIKDLPGYIKLHETVRDLDVAVKLMGITSEDTKGGGGQAVLIVDASKTYAQGAMENATLYPNLPPRKVEFDRRGGQDFSM